MEEDEVVEHDYWPLTVSERLKSLGFTSMSHVMFGWLDSWDIYTCSPELMTSVVTGTRGDGSSERLWVRTGYYSDKLRSLI